MQSRSKSSSIPRLSSSELNRYDDEESSSIDNDDDGKLTASLFVVFVLFVLFVFVVFVFVSYDVLPSVSSSWSELDAVAPPSPDVILG
jgi:hypothetical protein